MLVIIKFYNSSLLELTIEVRHVTDWEFVPEANGTPKELGSGAYGTVSYSSMCRSYHYCVL